MHTCIKCMVYYKGHRFRIPFLLRQIFNSTQTECILTKANALLEIMQLSTTESNQIKSTD